MKTCSYCGKESPNDSVYCPGCGTAFAASEKQPSSDSFRRPPRPEAATVVLRAFSRETSAHLALAALRSARIEAFVATDDCGGLYPPLSGGGAFRLIVSEVHREAAELVLGNLQEGEVLAPEQATLSASEITAKSAPSHSTLRCLGAAVLGMVAGALMVLGYQRSQEKFSGADRRDYNLDGRTDAWDTYVQGQLSKVAIDHDGNERPDAWYHYDNDGRLMGWEQDANFDDKVDSWATCDNRTILSQSKSDLDFDGKPDVTCFYQHGLVSESHYVLPDSGLLWKKSFFTNGLLREELLDRDRDGKFDEKLLFDIYGVELSKQALKL